MTLLQQGDNNNKTLQGEVAVITGASRGIGAAIAAALAKAGAGVVINYRSDEQGALATLQQCEALGAQAVAVKTDIRNEESATNLILAATQLGSPSILVNNAGIALDKLMIDTSVDEWNDVIATNLTGPFLCAKAILPHLLRRQWGRIINLSSIWGISGAAGETAYSATKGGIIAWTKALARELAPAQITVNAVAPGAVETDMLKHLSAEDRAVLINEIPAGRIGTPEDIAHLIVYLASKQASYLTGQVVSVNGGILT